MAAGDKPIDDFSPVPQGFVNVEYGNLEDIMSATTEKTAAVMLEPVQGEGGVNIPTREYLQGVRKWCDDNGLQLIFDEVQTGFGRLGTLFGYESFGVEPDVMTLAKGLGGGVPIGAFMLKDEAIALVPGDHGSTYGGNVLTTAAAYASTKYLIDNDIPAHAAEMGEYLRTGLNAIKDRHSFIIDVRGMGLLNAVEFDREMAAATLTACNARGLLLNFTRPQLIRIMPPLTVSESEIDTALERLEEGLVQAAAA
jgi:acetylornithine/succinyldiaminopimelate/putrescine aminotransferase